MAQAFNKITRVFSCVTLIILLVSMQVAADAGVEKGKLDIRHVDLANTSPLSLDGEWEFYWKSLLTPQDFDDIDLVPDFIQVPLVWNGEQTVAGQVLTGNGYATYRMVLTKSRKYDLLSLYLPNVYTSYSIWVNGKLLASNGKTAVTAGEAQATWKPQIKVFEAPGETVEIVMQVSNFHHNRGGMHKTIRIGSPDSVIYEHASIVISNVLLFGGLLILGAFFIGFFFIRRGQRATLFFGLLCFSWAIRSLFSNNYIVTSIFEDVNWQLAIKVEYISLYLSMLFGMLFISHVFLHEKRSIFKYIIITINYILIALTVLLPPIFFTALLPAYQFFISINFVYIIIAIVAAICKNQKEAWFSALSIAVGITLFAYELTAYLFVISIDYIYLNLGYLLVFFLNSLVLAHHFVGAYKQVHVLELEKTTTLERRLRSA